jgi:Ca-activated chloride channel homolog
MLKRLISVALALAFALPALPSEQAGRFNETLNVGYVVVPFVARDRSGKPLEALRARDVRLRVDGREVALDMFEKVGDAPVSYTILLDGSGSMGLSGKMDGARIAISALLERARKGDDFSLHLFAEEEVRELVPFTTDVRRVMNAVYDVQPWGKTAFFDALAKMPDRSLLGRNGSRAIVLVTDGFDNASSMTVDQLNELLSGVDVPVYAIGIRPRASVELERQSYTDALLDLDILRRLSEATGGRAAILDDPTDLRNAILDIEKELRAQYLVGFSPTGRGGVRYRRIELELPRRARTVHVRAGYRGTEPPLRNRSR